MKSLEITACFVLLFMSNALAATHYVDINNATPSSPYISWGTAATNIQDAIDAAVAGETVLVNDGNYDSGSTTVPGNACANRVAITNNILLQSVNGPELTFIVGAGPLGASAVRGMYMSEGTLSGFTVTQGHTRTGGLEDSYGGGAFCTSGSVLITNCTFTGNAAEFGGGVEVDSGTLVLADCILSNNSAIQGGGLDVYFSTATITNCTLTGNTAEYGGGMEIWFSNLAVNDCTLSENSAIACGGGIYLGETTGTVNTCLLDGNSAGIGGGSYGDTLLYNCILTNNSARHISTNSIDLSSGGGNYGGTLYNCTLTGNSAGGSGGGNCDGTLYNCTLTGNSAQFGGGNDGGTLYNCTLTGNSAASGGGNLDGTLYNCTLTGNSAASGGGNYGGTLYNCTIVENTATSTGGGTRRGTLYNCILYNNMPSDWWHLWIEPEPYFAYCRIDRNPGGIGNITSLPSFVAPGDYHLASNSPCINAGSNGYVNVAADLDGHPRIVGGMVDMGAYESGFTGCFITNGIANGSDVLLEWTAFPMWESTVQYSTNLVTMPFTDLSAPMPYPANSYTDLVHGAESECFYKVLIQP